jgi:hypothetical protein
MGMLKRETFFHLPSCKSVFHISGEKSSLWIKTNFSGIFQLIQNKFSSTLNDFHSHFSEILFENPCKANMSGAVDELHLGVTECRLMIVAKCLHSFKHEAIYCRSMW